MRWFFVPLVAFFIIVFLLMASSLKKDDYQQAGQTVEDIQNSQAVVNLGAFLPPFLCVVVFIVVGVFAMNFIGLGTGRRQEKVVTALQNISAPNDYPEPENESFSNEELLSPEIGDIRRKLDRDYLNDKRNERARTGETFEQQRQRHQAENRWSPKNPRGRAWDRSKKGTRQYADRGSQREFRDYVTEFFRGVKVRYSPNIYGGVDMELKKNGRITLEMSYEGNHVYRIVEVHGKVSHQVYRGGASGAIDYIEIWKGGDD